LINLVDATNDVTNKAEPPNQGRRLLGIQQTVLDRRCEAFGSSDRTGVGGMVDADLSLTALPPVAQPDGGLR